MDIRTTRAAFIWLALLAFVVFGFFVVGGKWYRAKGDERNRYASILWEMAKRVVIPLAVLGSIMWLLSRANN